MAIARKNGEQRGWGAQLLLVAVVTGAIGCSNSGPHQVADGGDGMPHQDAARVPDGPTDSQVVEDAPTRADTVDHEAGPGATIGPGLNTLEALITPRTGHTSTLLANGQVLIVGGQDLTYDSMAGDISEQFKAQTVDTAEVHDVDTGAVAATRPLTAARFSHTATLLPNGKVLIVGGSDGSVPIGSAELYDPAMATFTATGLLNAARQFHTATLLPSGKVLICGGRGTAGGSVPVAAAELYDPTTGTFTNTGSMLSPRYQHTATLLANGKVLIAGGYKFGTVAAMGTSELYNPATGMFSATGSLSVARYNHTATLLGNGKVLVAGGQGDFSSVGAYVDYATAELYDPAAGTFSATGSLSIARLAHSATLLSDGTVLVAGGYNHASGYTYLASAEVYEPASGTFSAVAPMIDARYGHTATTLADGRVLPRWRRRNRRRALLIQAPMPSARVAFSDQPHRNGAGRRPGVVRRRARPYLYGNAAVFDPARLVFVPTGQPTAMREAGTATLLADGRVFLIGGLNLQNVPMIPAEIYSPATGTFTSGALPITQREGHTATLLANGKVLIAGGGSCTVLSSTDVFDPTAGTFTASGSMASPRGRHTATLLSNGKVLVAGGMSNAAALATAESSTRPPGRSRRPEPWRAAGSVTRPR